MGIASKENELRIMVNRVPFSENQILGLMEILNEPHLTEA